MIRTLVTDDDGEIRDVVSLVLGREGHHVTTATNGAQAIDRLGTTEFDLVVVDHHMPVVAGVDVLSHVFTHHPRTSLVLMSSDHRLVEHPTTQSTRAVFLPKPFTRRSLIAAVEAAVSRYPHPTA